MKLIALISLSVAQHKSVNEKKIQKKTNRISCYLYRWWLKNVWTFPSKAKTSCGETAQRAKQTLHLSVLNFSLIKAK